MNLDILVNGVAVTKYRDQYGNMFIEGRRGSAYELRITDYYVSSGFYLGNPIRAQKLVISVDGKNILTGDQKWDKGYVLPENQSTLTIPGWRINQNEIAKFVFADLKDGYSTGDGSNVGVIGMRTYWEDVPPPIHYDSLYRGIVGSSSDCRGRAPAGGMGIGIGTPTGNWNLESMNCSASAESPLATGWGEKQEFQTKSVDKKFFSTPSATIVLYYDSAKGLAKRGIHVNTRTVPNPFPGDDFGCPPPVQGG